MNDEGAVDLQDFSLLKANFGTAAVLIPEPVTLILLSVAAPVLLKRKRNA